jgi:DNA-directed RNA polymerase, mitochondrial
VDEMFSVFAACLQVGKLDRAALVLKRLGKVDGITGEKYIRLHNQYLRASLDQMRLYPNERQAEELHKWYELYIRSEGLPQTAETVACMLKASILSERGPRLNRLVTRYMGMVPGEAGLHVLSMADILSDQDLAIITAICPTYNLATEVSTALVITGESRQRLLSHIPTADDFPEVLSTPQKGFGLKTVKQTLTLFNEIPQSLDISTLPRQERREIQSRLERDCIDAAVERWKEDNESLRKMGLNPAISHNSLNSRLYDWHIALEARLQDELAKIDISESTEKKSKEDLDRCMYGPFLRQSSASRLAAVTILSTLSTSALLGGDKGIPLTAAITSIGKIAEEDIFAQSQNQKRLSALKKKLPRRVVQMVARSSALTAQTEPQESNLTQANAGDSATPSLEPTNARIAWPTAIRAKVGAALLSALIETAKIKVIKEDPQTQTLISQFQPAFTHATQFRKGKKIGMVLLNQELTNLIKREPRGDFLAKHLPMIVEPEPWSVFDKGGFLESTSNLVRIKHDDKDQRIYAEAAIARGDMDQILKGLDVLGKTAWRINNPVLNVMLEAWNSGKELANIPPLNPAIPIPEEPDSSEDPMARRSWIRAVKAAENEKSGLHSVRCFMNFQLEIARAFRNQTFFFPHNIDFRGRAYPIPTYLNHMGADHVRGLLRFAEGKELGEKGLKWLKVHLANVFGFDKASLGEREAFSMDHIADIIDSAMNPLTGNRWWLKAEDPWQCLAACYELKAALESPEPTKFVSHLPVHQDGTCNGLQHYAALGGDAWGAAQVNLQPGDRPADVYSAVANIVKESIAKDAAAGNPLAKALDGKITRKVVKQTVMTNVYGVTFAGAKKQVCKQLDALYPNLHQESGYDPIMLSSYTARLIFTALSTMFRGAHDIQYWLGEVGGRVCRALTPEQLDRIENDPSLLQPKTSTRSTAKAKKTSTDELFSQFRATIVWTTPLRMPIAQPYRKNGSRVISTCMQDLMLTTPQRSDPVNRRKQLQAFPPNFIHSLDATHMLLSALECYDKGLTFAAVHDSFWAHAADVDVMNSVLRDSFIRIHSEDVVGRLAAEFEARYRGSIYLAKINQGTEVEKKITALRKKARMSLKDELLLERKRLNLLKSNDPKEVAEGRRMVTPASIFEETMAAVQDLAEPEDMEELRLGEIPEGETSADAAESSVADEDGDLEMDPAVEVEAEPTSEEHTVRLLDGMQKSHFETQVTEPKRKAKEQKPTIQVWLPLTFPAIPMKVRASIDIRSICQCTDCFTG